MGEAIGEMAPVPGKLLYLQGGHHQSGSVTHMQGPAVSHHRLDDRRTEGVGFEPTNACTLTVFKTVAFNHSATPPLCCAAPKDHKYSATASGLIASASSPLAVGGVRVSSRA